MSLITGLKTGLVTGLICGLGTIFAGESGPTELADLDFRTPATQSFPGTATGFASAVGDVTATPSYIWLCDETSGNLIDEIASEPLVPTNSPLQDREGYIWTGSAFSKTCVEITGANQRFVSDDAAVMNSDGTSVAFVINVRMAQLPGSNAVLIEKRAGGGAYFRLAITTTGAVLANGYDGSDIFQTATNPGVIAPGAWHTIAGVWNMTDDTITAIIETEASTPVDSSTMTTLDSAGFLEVGDAVGNAFNGQIAYIAALEDAAAEAIDLAAVQNLHRIGSDPTGLLTTIDRDCLISVPLSDSTVGHYAPNQLPIGQHGLFCNSAVTNLMSYSEDFAGNWIDSNTTRTGNDADAPDGFRSATRLTATSNNGAMYRNVSGIDANTEYTTSVWVKRVGGSDVSGVLRYRDLDATVDTNQAFTATDTWQRVSVTATHGATATADGRVYVFVDTSAEEILVWGCQVEEGSEAGAYIRTDGAPASLVYPDYSISSSAGEYMKGATGEVEAVFRIVKIPDGSSEHIWGAGQGTGLNNLRTGVIQTSQAYQPGFRDSSGSNVDTLSEAISVGPEFTMVSRWDSSGGLAVGGGVGAELLEAGVSEDTYVGTWTGSDTIDTLRLGNRTFSATGDTYAPNAWLSRLRIWDAERTA